MDEYFWVLLFVAFWVYSAVKGVREQRKKRERQERRDHPREIVARTGPQAGRRDLARVVDEAARRAEDALQQWEARQREITGEARRAGEPAPVPVDHAPRPVRIRHAETRMRAKARQKARALEEVRERRTAGGRRDAERRRAREERRREADAVIARMRSEAVPQVDRHPVTLPPRSLRTVATPAAGTAGPSPASATPPRSEGPTATAPTPATGFRRLDRLPELQRAIVLSEILRPPKALRREPDLP